MVNSSPAFSACEVHSSGPDDGEVRKLRPKGKRRWQKPRTGELKLNIDGAFNCDKHDGGWGFILRDDQGRVVSSGAGREDFLLDAFQAELLGCLAGLQEVARMGISHIN